MIRDHLINMGISFSFRNLRIFAQCDFTNVIVKYVMFWITVVVRFVRFDGVRIPLARENATSTSFFKTSTNTSDTGKQINKVELTLAVWWRRFGQQVLQMYVLSVAQLRTALTPNPSVNSFPSPGARRNLIQVLGNKFLVIALESLLKKGKFVAIGAHDCSTFWEKYVTHYHLVYPALYSTIYCTNKQSTPCWVP